MLAFFLTLLVCFGDKFSCVLLTGGMSAPKKRAALDDIREGRVNLIVGTHALIQEKVLQDSYLLFHKEFLKTKVQPAFVTDKTIAADIAKMAGQYVEAMKAKFDSKLSLCMDVWTGPNKMSFLEITFTYLDNNYTIQRPLGYDQDEKESYGRVYC